MWNHLLFYISVFKKSCTANLLKISSCLDNSKTPPGFDTKLKRITP